MECCCLVSSKREETSTPCPGARRHEAFLCSGRSGIGIYWGAYWMAIVATIVDGNGTGRLRKRVVVWESLTD